MPNTQMTAKSEPDLDEDEMLEGRNAGVELKHMTKHNMFVRYHGHTEVNRVSWSRSQSCQQC